MALVIVLNMSSSVSRRNTNSQFYSKHSKDIYRGVYFSFCLPPRGVGGGQKYELLVGRGKNIRGKRCKKGGKEEIFTAFRGKI